ncbi:hypothetical protein [Mucilaginibacter jinjuensis]|uniref:Uncharacterized protein n=1 Tax=Mucilaginibacter jinjuensis TaxID=1176721 RepID=A0ABY7T777_9SPHI|nr:hypothetical protein [Mucilaginibacter jinjuensis]WCT11691.1 hypothetical protein PQO05_23455 [Mucilaginibacter jinjuensis]
MKPLILSLLITFSFLNAFAQPVKEKAVEADLRKCFNKINYWELDENRMKSDTSMDSLNKANQVFAAKLKNYATAYPAILTMSLKSLSPDVKILTSADQQFRIYSWSTGMSGTIGNCGNVIQYKAGPVVKSILDIGTMDEFNQNYFFELHSLNINGQNYYVALVSRALGDSGNEEAIKMFAINNVVLDDKVKIIKTTSGLHNSINYAYNGGSEESNPPNPDIEYNDATQTFTLPVVVAKGKVTRNRIIYKFTGQYFERVKN